jgi:hypothetical protein
MPRSRPACMLAAFLTAPVRLIVRRQLGTRSVVDIMNVKAQTGKALACLVGAAVLAGTVILGNLVYQHQIPLINSDPRFHLDAVKILRTPSDCMFFGNQLEARARLHLWARTGLKIPLLPFLPPLKPSLVPGSVKSGPDLLQPCVLAIHYRWANPQSRSLSLRVELVDGAGQVFPARNTFGFPGRNNSQFEMWDLNEGRTKGGTYRVKIKDHEKCLAELELSDLPPVPSFHLGPNAF